MGLGLSDLSRLLKSRDYRWYVAGNLASTTGLWVQRVAIGWLAWDLTGSPGWLGVIAAAEAGPTILFGLFSGALLDRLDQLRTLRFTQALTLLYSTALLAASLTGVLNIWLLTALVLFRGTLFSINRPARQTIVYALCGRELLSNGLAFNAAVFNTAKFVGPAVGGATIIFSGISGTLAAALALQLIFTVALARISVSDVKRGKRDESSILRDIADGFAYLMSHRGVRVQFAILIAVSLLAKPLADLLPGFAAGVFAKGPGGLAVMYMMNGIGAVAAGFWLSARGQAGLVAVSIACIIAMSVALMAFATTSLFWLACVLLLCIGFAKVAIEITNQTLVQIAIRTRFRGRTMSTYGMIAQGAPAIGALGMGFLAEFTGLRGPVLGGAAICLLVGMGAWARRRYMEEHLQPRSDEPA